MCAGNLGTGFGIVTTDVGGNINRLQKRCDENPQKYSKNLYAIIEDELEDGRCIENDSCSKGLLWLTRCVGSLQSVMFIVLLLLLLLSLQEDDMYSGIVLPPTHPLLHMHLFCRAMKFILHLLDTLQKDKESSLSEIATQAYYDTLQQYHGWIVTGTFTVVLKLVPSREGFWQALLSCAPPQDKEDQGRQSLEASMAAFCPVGEALILDIWRFLKDRGLDDPTKV